MKVTAQVAEVLRQDAKLFESLVDHFVAVLGGPQQELLKWPSSIGSDEAIQTFDDGISKAQLMVRCQHFLGLTR